MIAVMPGRVSEIDEGLVDIVWVDVVRVFGGLLRPVRQDEPRTGGFLRREGGLQYCREPGRRSAGDGLVATYTTLGLGIIRDRAPHLMGVPDVLSVERHDFLRGSARSDQLPFAKEVGDGLLDLVSGAANGALLAWRNTGTSEAPSFTALTGAANPFNDINVGYASAPSFVDLDGDGLLDVIEAGANPSVPADTGGTAGVADYLDLGA
jgi:hypothetical protein